MALAAASRHAAYRTTPVQDGDGGTRTTDAPRGLNTAGAQRGQKLGGAEFFNETCLLERTVKNIVDVRRPQVEEAVELVM